jgi:hypothetical protein
MITVARGCADELETRTTVTMPSAEGTGKVAAWPLVVCLALIAGVAGLAPAIRAAASGGSVIGSLG